MVFQAPWDSGQSNDPSKETSSPDAGFFLYMIIYLGMSLGVVIIEIWWMHTMFNELNLFRGYLYNPLFAACVPFFNIYAFYKYTEALEQEFNYRRMGKSPEPVLYCCLFFVFALGLPLLQSKMNELWTALMAYGDPLSEPPHPGQVHRDPYQR